MRMLMALLILTLALAAPISAVQSNKGSLHMENYMKEFLVPPELVYVTFDHHVLNADIEQIIRLDAKNFKSDVVAASATIQSPDGTRMNHPLRLVKGDENYGTWESAYVPVGIGLHEIVAVTLTDGFGREHITPVQDRRFYLADVSQQQRLHLVYTTLDQSTIGADESITLRLDAADERGITWVEAAFTSSTGITITKRLDRVNGEAIYGSWETSFTPDEAGTTYAVTSVRLSNGRDTTRISVEDRTFYVEPVVKIAVNTIQSESSQPLVTGHASLQRTRYRSFREAFREPLLPTILAFSLMFVVLTALFIHGEYRTRGRRTER